jgi:flavin-dependent dehydrogenase
MDRARFPRDKVCAGWITPQVIAALDLDLDDYRHGRTLQPVRGFRTGVIGGADGFETMYDHPVSYGIRRCEFDHYLLQRSNARLRLGEPVTAIRREGDRWILNDEVDAPMLVGAGGHFCPVARRMNPAIDRASLVAAQEAEIEIDGPDSGSWTTAPDVPALYYCRDLTGYGWCFRKERHINIGLGRVHARALPKASDEFVAFLRDRGVSPAASTWRWRGHAYLVAEGTARCAVSDGILLAGDAAGLAYPRSGEGIRPAVESGLLAAAAILRAEGRYARRQLEEYEQELGHRYGADRHRLRLSRAFQTTLAAALAPALFESRWFVRHVLIHRWFLRANEPAMAVSGGSGLL